MSHPAISAKNISKVYRIAARQEKYQTLRDAMGNALAAPLRYFRSQLWAANDRPSTAAARAPFQALRDVSFDIEQGEVVGIVGRNGAGKSTLLKILSRITEPTSGGAEVHGRVGSLLEVGTGFHQELTGRENIYLNGAILGMRKTEIRRKFDEIVAFAEVERFIDTPVKYYSTGMQLRLAFAVAAHLEPEILLVDEVLAVGDARFQKKCLNKMQDVGSHGRTILFVSHNMPAVTRLCRRCLLLDGGKLVQDGPSARIVSAYLHSGLGTSAAREWQDPATAPAGDVARLRAVRVRSAEGWITEAIDIRAAVGVESTYDVLQSGHLLMPFFMFFNEEGVHAFSANDLDPVWRQRPRPAGRYVSTVWIPGNLLSEGTMFVGAGLATERQVLQFYEPEAVAFHVFDSLDGNSARGDFAGRIRGIVRPLLKWSTEFKPQAHASGSAADEERSELTVTPCKNA